MESNERVEPIKYQWAWEAVPEGHVTIPMCLECLDGSFVSSEVIVNEFETMVMLKNTGYLSGDVTMDEIKAIARKHNVHTAKVKSLLKKARLITY